MKGLNKLMQNIVLAMSEDVELMKLLHYNIADKDLNDLPEPELDEVLGVKLLDYTYVPDVTEDANSYISLSFDNIEKANSRKAMSSRSETLKQLDIVVTAFTHYSLIKFYGGNRLLAIMDRVEKIFTQARMEDVVGKFDLSVAKEVTSIPKYNGYDIIFRITTIPSELGVR